jgi:hypothetical protein
MRKFVSISVVDNNGNISLQFINIDHIVRIYEKNSKIFIDLTEYTTLETTETNTHLLLDRIV